MVPMKTMESMERMEPVESMEATESMESLEATASMGSMKPTASMDSTEFMASTESMDSAVSMASTESMESTESMASTEWLSACRAQWPRVQGGGPRGGHPDPDPPHLCCFAASIIDSTRRWPHRIGGVGGFTAVAVGACR